MRHRKPNTTDHRRFMDAVTNGDWEQATELYNTLDDKQLKDASSVIPRLVKQFKNAALLRVLADYPSLNIDAMNSKGQTALIVAFGCANEEAALNLHAYGANVFAYASVQSIQNDIVQYALWTGDRSTIALAKEMLDVGCRPRGKPIQRLKLKPAEDDDAPLAKRKQDPTELAAAFMKRRKAKQDANEPVKVVGDINHYAPEF